MKITEIAKRPPDINLEKLAREIEQYGMQDQIQDLIAKRSIPPDVIRYPRKPKSVDQVQPPRDTGLNPDVKVVSSASPLVLRYKTQDFALSDDNMTWVRFGSNREASPEMSRFLHKQLRLL